MLPRLLVLSAAVPETHLAGSLLLYRMLQTYPIDRLLAVGPAPRGESLVLGCPYRVLEQNPSSRLNATRLARLKRSMQMLGLVGRIPLRRVEKLVGDFAPDVVVSVMEQADYVDVARRFCRARKLPLVLIVHDRLESFELVYPGFRRAQLRRNAAVYRSAFARLCVSPEMEESLRCEYGAPGSVLYPIRSDSVVARPAADSGRLKDPTHLTLGYAGSLAYGYGDRIREAMPALRDVGVRLRLYSRDRLADLVEGIAELGAMPTAEETWHKVVAECDAVWLPYSHARRHRALYETHFPSKLAEYLALGMPVLITGPKYATGVKWGLRHTLAALTVSAESVEVLQAAATRLRDDGELRVSLASQALNAGNTDFAPEAIRSQFLQILTDAAAG